MVILLISVQGLLVPSSARAQCASFQGANSAATTGFSTATLTGSSFSWSNVGGAQAQDASYASAGISLGILSSAYSNYLVAQNFGFSIPSTAIICEIVVQVERSVSGLGLFGAVNDHSVRLLKAGVPTGSDPANTSLAWPSSDATATYGNSSATGLWGDSWQPSDVNDPGFGVAIATILHTGVVSLFMTARINRLQVTVYYDNTTVLGIPLQHFAVTREGDANLLSWTASSAMTDVMPDAASNPAFTLQRSADARSWQDLAAIPAHSAANDDQASNGQAPNNLQSQDGSSAGEGSYSYTDDKPLMGPNLYRLRWQNAQAQPVYSTIVQIIQENGHIHCYPNPFLHTINISSPVPVYSVVLKDMQGRTLRTREYGSAGAGLNTNAGPNPGDQPATGASSNPAAAYNLQIPVDGLPPGLYFIRVNGSVFKMLKN